MKFTLLEAGINVRNGVKQEEAPEQKWLVGGMFPEIDKSRMLLFIYEYGKKNKWSEEKVNDLRDKIKSSSREEAVNVFEKEFRGIVKIVREIL